MSERPAITPLPAENPYVIGLFNPHGNGRVKVRCTDLVFKQGEIALIKIFVVPQFPQPQKIYVCPGPPGFGFIVPAAFLFFLASQKNQAKSSSAVSSKSGTAGAALQMVLPIHMVTSSGEV